MRKVIDIHSHVYPDKIARRVVDTTLQFYQIPTAQGTGTPEDLLAPGMDDGITYHVIHSAATRADQVHTINDYIASIVAQHPDRFIGFGALYQGSTHMEDDVAYVQSHGFRGIKIHPDMQRFPLNGPETMRLFEACRGKLAVLFHAGDERYDNSNPEQLIPVLEAFPDVTMIGAHMAGYRVWEYAAKQLAGRFPNLYVDCSSCFFAVAPEKMLDMIRAFGADHVLFGSDYPLWSPKTELETLLRLGLTDAELELILWKNAAQILQLPDEA